MAKNAMLNIPSTVSDPEYRYKMPRVISRLECRGKGSKTGILNMAEVARALERDPVYLTKFFLYELGAQTSYTNKEAEGERVVVSGHHDTSVFQALVDKFVDKYVLCQECKLPEIDMVVNKKGLVVATCKACGWKGKLDNDHKLATYIQKYPPGTGVGFDADKPKQSREERQRTRAAKQKKNTDEDTASYESGEENEAPNTSKKDKEKEGGGKLSKTGLESEEQGKPKKTEKKEKKEKTERKEKKNKKDKKDKHAKDRSDSEDDLTFTSEGIKSVVIDLVNFVRSQEERGKLTPDAMFEEVRRRQVAKVFNNKLRIFVVVSALFPEGSLVAKGVESNKDIINLFIDKGEMSFSEWIWGFEAYLACFPSARNSFPLTLKALYDADLAEEEDILGYYRQDQHGPGFELAKKALEPFLSWLQQADESDNEDDD